MPSVWREYCCCDNVLPKAWDSVALWTRIKLVLGEPVFERPVDVEGLRGIPPGTWAHQTVSLSKMGHPRIWSKEDGYCVEKRYEVPKGYWRRPQERLRATTTGLWWLILLLAVPATCQLRMNVWTHALLQCSVHHLVTLRRHDRAHCCHCPESPISRCSHGPFLWFSQGMSHCVHSWLCSIFEATLLSYYSTITVRRVFYLYLWMRDSLETPAAPEMKMTNVKIIFKGPGFNK